MDKKIEKLKASLPQLQASNNPKPQDYEPSLKDFLQPVFIVIF
jgi:hypothetical protein